MKVILVFFILTALNEKLIYAQSDSLTTRNKSFHDASAYIDFQFPNGADPLITTQVWAYIKNFYIEARYNYEDRKAASLFFGRAYFIDKQNTFQIIPMVGYSFGKITGISPGVTMVFEEEKFRGFSQNQYFVDLSGSSNFFFSWSALVAKLKNPLYLGVSEQLVILNNEIPQFFIGPMASVKKLPIIIEFFLYNFWKNDRMLAIGCQYFF